VSAKLFIFIKIHDTKLLVYNKQYYGQNVPLKTVIHCMNRQ